MAKGTNSLGIFRRTDEIISDFLGLRHGETLNQKTTCRRLSSTPLEKPRFERLVSDLYERIEKNRSERSPSKSNWQPRRQTYLNPENKSPEVLLERAIAILGRREILGGWYNQIPVASGLVDDRADKRAAIDLLLLEDGRAEFVELKWESDSPVFAAFEILLYGLAYLFARVNRKTLGYLEKPLMSVSEVSLRVLAPHAYYTGYNLTWLEQGLDEGVRTLATKKTDGVLPMGFGFLAFPQVFAPDFSPPYATGNEVRQKFDPPEDAEACQSLVSAMSNLEPAFPSGEREHS